MVDGQEEIAEAEKAMFDWISEDPRSQDEPWSNFSECLHQGNTLYWITSKAGAGKSTLMKYLFGHPRVTSD